jgi:hypothetical protein
MRKKILVVLAAVLLTIGTPAAAAPGETYDQYSLMFERSAGQYWAGGVAAGQWSWSPSGAAGTSDISWGDPKTWPPSSAERFVRSGDWVLLEGYNDGAGRPLTQIQLVTSEKIGSATCTGIQPLASAGGRQHYVRWTIPSVGYCLDAVGTIKPPNGSTTVNFRHLQRWSPPHACANAYFSGQTCITQFEEWWDDNRHAFGLQLSRTVELARGKGMAFTNHTTVPVVWNAEGRNYWQY